MKRIVGFDQNLNADVAFVGAVQLAKAHIMKTKKMRDSDYFVLFCLWPGKARFWAAARPEFSTSQSPRIEK